MTFDELEQAAIASLSDEERAGGRVAVDAQFPPFLRGMPPGLRVVYQAPGVPDWTVAAE